MASESELLPRRQKKVSLIRMIFIHREIKQRGHTGIGWILVSHSLSNYYTCEVKQTDVIGFQVEHCRVLSSLL